MELKPYQAYSHRTHGVCTDHPDLYGVWCSMKGRCENPNRPKYKDYGGRGIKVCDEWHDYQTFKEWALENGYDENAPFGECTLDRIDPYGNYEPSNCRWVGMDVQAKNKRTNASGGRP